MLTAILLFMFIVCFAALWWQGLWGNAYRELAIATDLEPTDLEAECISVVMLSALYVLNGKLGRRMGELRPEFFLLHGNLPRTSCTSSDRPAERLATRLISIRSARL